jgi:hypothetical protein
MIFDWKEFDPQTRIWVYQSDRNLSQAEIDKMLPLISSFCTRWTAHDKALKAKGEIRYKRFLILGVDESKNPATGCSIDKSVHFLKELQAEFNLNWFDRMWQAYLNQDKELKVFHVSEFNTFLDDQELNPDSILFDNSIQELWQLDSQWMKPLKDSWLAKKLERWEKSKGQMSK